MIDRNILRLPLAAGVNFYAARNALELAVLREERRILQKQLAAWESARTAAVVVPGFKPAKRETCEDVVVSVFNGHPLRRTEVFQRVSDCASGRFTRNTVSQALTTAKEAGRLVNGGGLWSRPHSTL